MNVGVSYLGRRIDRIHVAIPGLDRWPFHGFVGGFAYRFDGRTLKLVRCAIKAAKRFSCLSGCHPKEG